MANAAPRTSIYVDAFNLYYGALKNTPYKWLDLEALCQAYLKENNITSIKYFTAKVSARPNDPQQPARQQAYLRALQTLPTLKIIFGHYLSHTVTARLASPPEKGGPHVKVLLRPNTDCIKQIRKGALEASQFPDSLQDADHLLFSEAHHRRVCHAA